MFETKIRMYCNTCTRERELGSTYIFIYNIYAERYACRQVVGMSVWMAQITLCTTKKKKNEVYAWETKLFARERRTCKRPAKREKQSQEKRESMCTLSKKRKCIDEHIRKEKKKARSLFILGRISP